MAANNSNNDNDSGFSMAAYNKELDKIVASVSPSDSPAAQRLEADNYDGSTVDDDGGFVWCDDNNLEAADDADDGSTVDETADDETEARKELLGGKRTAKYVLDNDSTDYWLSMDVFRDSVLATTASGTATISHKAARDIIGLAHDLEYMTVLSR